MRGASHDRWPLLAIGSWLWALEHSHLRVYLALTCLASDEPTQVRDAAWGTVDVPALSVVTSLERLAASAQVTREMVRWALKSLASGPRRDGRSPAIVVVRTRAYTLISLDSNTGSQAATNTTDARQVVSDNEPLRVSLAPQQHGTIHQEQHSTNTTQRAASNTSLSAEIPSRSIDLPASADAEQHDGIGHQHHDHPPPLDGTVGALFPEQDPVLKISSDLDTIAILQTIVGDRSGSVEGEPAKPKPPTKTRADQVSEACWLMADYLRSAILTADPSDPIATKPWAKDKRTGTRLAWAEEFSTMGKRDKRTPRETRERIDWLFGGQTADREFRIVIRSPEALRRKWGQITDALARQAAAKTPKAAPAKPSSVPIRKLKEA